MTNKKILILVSLLLISFLLVGCNWFVSNQAPEITSTSVKTATVEIEYVYDVEATDPNPKDVLTYFLTTEPDGMLIDEDNGVITWTPDTVGNFDVTVVVSDRGGLSDTQSFTITVTPVPVAPTLATIASPQIAYYGEVFTYTVVATAGTGPTLTFSLPIAPTMMSINTTTGVISWTPIATQLGYNNVTVKVTANDGLSDEASFIVEVREPIPPVVELTSIVVLPETMSLFVGSFEAIVSVTAHYSDGTTAILDLKDCDSISSDNTNIATVNKKSGEVTAVAEGEATITVEYKGKTDTIAVTVEVRYSFTDTQDVSDGTVGDLVTTVTEDSDWMVWTFDFPVENFTGDGNLNVALIIALDGDGKGPAFQIHNNDGTDASYDWGTWLMSPWGPTIGYGWFGWHSTDVNTPVTDLDWVEATGNRNVPHNGGVMEIRIKKSELGNAFHWAASPTVGTGFFAPAYDVEMEIPVGFGWDVPVVDMTIPNYIAR